MEKLKYLDTQFLMAKRRDIDTDLRCMMHGITAANSISFPISLAEADERRLHQDKAIAACECLLIDLQDIIDTVPINKNWMTQVAPAIDHEIALLKAWRKSDNEKRRALREQDMKRWLKFIQTTINTTDDTAEVEILKQVYRVFSEAMERHDLELAKQTVPISYNV